MLKLLFDFFREVIQEGDDGSLQASIDDIIHKAKRKRYKITKFSKSAFIFIFQFSSFLSIQLDSCFFPLISMSRSIYIYIYIYIFNFLEYWSEKEMFAWEWYLYFY